MFVIRRATLSTDLTAYRRLWAARTARAHNRGIDLRIPSLTDAECAASETLVLCAERGQVVGAVAVIDQLPGLGWTDEEGRQETVGLGAMLTDPAYPHVPLSWVFAYWAEDRAARTGREWVHAVVPCERLAHHWQTACRWQRIRTHRHGRIESVLMQRRAGRNGVFRGLMEDRTADIGQGGALSPRDLVRIASASQ
ncbi:hypothetical protein ACFCZY_36175 [Streptomyces sp. NPDC056237]|uniref:hypothetical protein n=1 Tax=unclassified Streptomyces TaxID=2593676 RepID=UPI0035DD12F5